MAHKDRNLCPWGMGGVFSFPARHFLQNPRKILTPYIRKGMTVLEVGPGRGYFTLTITDIVGPSGRVIAVDLQERFLNVLRKKAKKAKVAQRIATRLASSSSLHIDDLAESVDFTIAIAAVSAIPDRRRLFEEIYQVMRPAGTVLLADPVSHFSQMSFETAVTAAESQGFLGRPGPAIWKCRSALLVRRC